MIDIDLRQAMQPVQLGPHNLRIELFATTNPNVALNIATYSSYTWKPSSDGFTILAQFSETIDGFFLIHQVYVDQVSMNKHPLFKNANTAIPSTTVFRVNNVKYLNNAAFGALSGSAGTVSDSVGSTSSIAMVAITPLSASAGTALQKIMNMFQNMIFYNGKKVILPDMILAMVSTNLNPLSLPNYFQVDESEINCTPATNYVAHDVSCNLLNNYGEDMLLMVVTVLLVIIVMIIAYTCLKKLKVLTFWHKVISFTYYNYGPTFLMVMLEGSNMELFGFTILNIFYANANYHQVMGCFLSAIVIVTLAVISFLGYQFIIRFRARLPLLTKHWEKEKEADKLLGEEITPEIVEFRQERQLERFKEQLRCGYMRFILEDYRLDLKDIYYMTPLITIAKNFISQIIVISLADKGMVQVYLVLAVHIGYTGFYIYSSPKLERVDNWISNITNGLFTLYTMIVVVVNSVDFSEDVIQNKFGMVMMVILILIIGINLIFVLYSVVQLIRGVLKMLCRKKTPLLVKIFNEADLMDYSNLGKSEKKERELENQLDDSVLQQLPAPNKVMNLRGSRRRELSRKGLRLGKKEPSNERKDQREDKKDSTDKKDSEDKITEKAATKKVIQGREKEGLEGIEERKNGLQAIKGSKKEAKPDEPFEFSSFNNPFWDDMVVRKDERKEDKKKGDKRRDEEDKKKEGDKKKVEDKKNAEVKKRKRRERDDEKIMI